MSDSKPSWLSVLISAVAASVPSRCPGEVERFDGMMPTVNSRFETVRTRSGEIGQRRPMTRLVVLATVLLLISACGGPSADAGADGNEPDDTPAQTPDPSGETETSAEDLPVVDVVEVLTPNAGRFERVDLSVEFRAEFENPFDQRQVALDAEFVDPEGSTWRLPGFYDGEEVWGFRFTPAVVGDWTVDVTVTDQRGTSAPMSAEFSVEESDRKGWIVPGDRADPDYSPRYLAHLDGTPWFGLGHADLEMTFGSFNGTTFEKMAAMPAAGENFEMWWPLWANNFFQSSYDDYKPAQMRIIDLTLAEAERNDVYIGYTIWNHQLLRTNNHPWGKGLWGNNGFRGLVEIDEFFTDDESWAWQENMYRYTIARWGYSTAIALWQTVSEINGTESYEHTDDWHTRVNQYFLDHDPYRHPTSGTKSGGEFWPSANEVADVPQMHVYEQFHANPVAAARIMADWTVAMWDDQDKPNWIGEYGGRAPQTYPEFFHNTIWATVAAGAAIGPIEWNDGFGYGRFSDEMIADHVRLRAFLETVDLIELDPERLTIDSDDPEVRGWGVAGPDGGIAWIQDALGEEHETGEAEDMDAIRARPPRSGVTITLDGELAGDIVVHPYDTVSGEWLDPIDVTCGQTCDVVLPTFLHDLALRIDGA